MNSNWWFIIYNVVIWLVCFWITKNKAKAFLINGGTVAQSQGSIILIYILFLFQALFIFYGGDDARYEKVVTESANFVGQDYNIAMGLESLYYYIAALVGGNYILWKMVVYGGALILTYLTSLNIKSNNFLFLYSFVLFVLANFGSSRNALAIAIFVYGISLIKKNRKISVILGIAISALSIFAHNSMILPVILLFVSFFKINKTRFVLLLLAIPLFVTLVNMIPDVLFLKTEIMESHLGNKVEVYDDAAGNMAYRTSVLNNLYDILNYIAVATFLFYSLRMDNRRNLPLSLSVIIRVSFFIAYSAIIILLSDLSIKGTLFYRYILLILPILYVVLPTLFLDKEILKNKKIKTVEYPAVVLNFEFMVMLIYYGFMGS